MHPVYSLDHAINKFFESLPGVTRQQCDDLAISLVGAPLKPTPFQGAFSYTVVAGASESKVIQFRTQISDLDMGTLNLARAIHGVVFPAFTQHGKIGNPPSALSVYIMDRCSGVTYIQARHINGLPIEPSPDAALWQSNTVADLAREVDDIHIEYRQKFKLLSQVLSPRFKDSIDSVLADLHLLFAATYPLALSHDDLCEMNIFVDSETGHLTGIIDWADAQVLPFGMSLCALENVLGFMDSKGWHYYSNHLELESLFWQTFHETVGGVSEEDMRTTRVARIAGSFLPYGFVWEDGIEQKPAKEDDSNLRYLDVLCKTGAQPREP